MYVWENAYLLSKYSLKENFYNEYMLSSLFIIYVQNKKINAFNCNWYIKSNKNRCYLLDKKIYLNISKNMYLKYIESKLYRLYKQVDQKKWNQFSSHITSHKMLFSGYCFY